LPKGKLVEIGAPDVQECFDWLRERFEPWRVSIFGNAIHLNVAEGEDLKNLESSLDGCKITSIRPIAFSLEDAFIDTIRRNDSIKSGDNP
jgi:ABC-2 type transport system ATP-binding protein